MQKLKDTLERMQAVKVKCTLTTLNSALNTNYGWDEMSGCGATETAQAHITTAGGTTTKHWNAEKYAAVRTIVTRAQIVQSPAELKKLLGLG